MDKFAPSQRHSYTYENRKIYEWDQTVSEVNIYIKVPPGVRGKQLFVEIKQSHIKVGITPNPPYLDVRQPFILLICVLRLELLSKSLLWSDYHPLRLFSKAWLAALSAERLGWAGQDRRVLLDAG